MAGILYMRKGMILSISLPGANDKNNNINNNNNDNHTDNNNNNGLFNRFHWAAPHWNYLWSYNTIKVK